MVPIEVMNRIIIGAFTLIGFVLGSVVTLIVVEIGERRRRDMERRNHDD